MAAYGVTADRFDRWAPGYDQSGLQPAYRASHAAALGAARRLVSQPRRVLDVGCGSGQLLRGASLVFASSLLVGADISAGMLSVACAARPPGARVQMVQTAAEHLPFPDAAFDLVLSTMSFRHWLDPGNGVREIGRVLAPGGVLSFANVFTSRRPGLLGRVAGRTSPTLPALLAAALPAAGLGVLGVHRVGGFGPITEITLVTARARPAR